MSFIDKLRFIKSKSEMNVIKQGSEILSESFLETMQKVHIIFNFIIIIINISLIQVKVLDLMNIQ